MGNRVDRWRSVDPFYGDHLAMLHDPRDSITQPMRERALSHLLFAHRYWHYAPWWNDGYAVRLDGIDDMVGMEI